MPQDAFGTASKKYGEHPDSVSAVVVGPSLYELSHWFRWSSWLYSASLLLATLRQAQAPHARLALPLQERKQPSRTTLNSCLST